MIGAAIVANCVIISQNASITTVAYAIIALYHKRKFAVKKEFSTGCGKLFLLVGIIPPPCLPFVLAQGNYNQKTPFCKEGKMAFKRLML